MCKVELQVELLDLQVAMQHEWPTKSDIMCKVELQVAMQHEWPTK